LLALLLWRLSQMLLANYGVIRAARTTDDTAAANAANGRTPSANPLLSPRSVDITVFGDESPCNHL